ncbi:MAG: MFS transporter [Acidobacteria bacterium]|nr:MFS transporter [Acidobacteriota bacterium]MBK8150520.1 MFS transporter [Acidobacteriota bacterium]MBK8810937.1 MFS transporter [Acidobacteriota bacterium]
MSFGFLGIQFGWGLQMANMSPIYKYLGADEGSIGYLWLAGPLTGLLVQPIVGAMSDRTWNRLGRRRPYFLVGAVLASICLILMPNSSAVWMAAGLLWIMDASINITMEPFRAFVGDKLPEEQRTLGFVMQSFFIGIGSTLANALPYILTFLGVVGVMKSGIPYSTLIAFIVGAAAFLIAVLWTVFSTGEYPPENMEEFDRKRNEGNIVGTIVKEIVEAISDMPTTMKQLAVVQFFTWFALPFMWQYYGIAVARHVFGAVDDKSDLFRQGTEWGGVCFAVYNFVCFLIAFAIPPLAEKIGRKGVHIFCLICGGLGLISTYFATGPYFLWLGMAGVGIAWASILSMPYVILAGAIKPERMGVYMGVFNLFIVIPQVTQNLLTPQIYKTVLGGDALNAVMLGGFSMLVAAVSVFIVRDVGAAKIQGTEGAPAGH